VRVMIMSSVPARRSAPSFTNPPSTRLWYQSHVSQRLQLSRQGMVNRKTISPYQTSSSDPFQVPQPPILPI
jgi:hypothetical protein